MEMDINSHSFADFIEILCRSMLMRRQMYINFIICHHTGKGAIVERPAVLLWWWCYYHQKCISVIRIRFLGCPKE